MTGQQGYLEPQLHWTKLDSHYLADLFEQTCLSFGFLTDAKVYCFGDSKRLSWSKQRNDVNPS